MMERYWRNEAAIDVLNLIAAIFLFLTPSIFRFASVAEASRNAWICGVAIGVDRSRRCLPTPMGKLGQSLVGLWLIVSPWVLGFHITMMSATRADLAVGITVAMFSAAALWFTRDMPPRATA